MSAAAVVIGALRVNGYIIWSFTALITVFELSGPDGRVRAEVYVILIKAVARSCPTSFHLQTVCSTVCLNVVLKEQKVHNSIFIRVA